MADEGASLMSLVLCPWHSVDILLTSRSRWIEHVTRWVDVFSGSVLLLMSIARRLRMRIDVGTVLVRTVLLLFPVGWSSRIGIGLRVDLARFIRHRGIGEIRVRIRCFVEDSSSCLRIVIHPFQIGFR